MRSTSGFTLVEMMVVIAIVSILIVAGMVGYNHYKEQYAFSGAVRELTHAITLARVRAVQSQTTSRLLFRPLQADPVPSWTGPPNHSAQNYNVGDIVQHGPWTYRCINPAGSTSSANTEPAAGANWRTDWEIIFDYQYNSLLLDVQHCASNLPINAQPCTDPNVCAWVQTNPYNIATPVSIQFNWSGVPVDYINHNIIIQGAQDAAGPPGQNRVGCVMLTVTSLGRIKHQADK